MELTPTEQRLYGVLRDGGPHQHEQLLDLLDSEGQAEIGLLRVHVFSLRRKLNRIGLEVLARNGSYQLVRIGSDE